MSLVLQSSQLPFCIEYDEQGKARISKESLEIASLLLFIESKRGKGGGLLQKKKAETIGFVSFVCWPFIFLKRGDTGRHMMFDTLGYFSETFHYSSMPPVQSLVTHVGSSDPTISNVGASDGTRIYTDPDVGAFLNGLRGFEDALDEFPGEVDNNVLGCLAHEDLMKDLLSLGDLSSADHMLTENAYVLYPRFGLEESKKALQQVLDVKNLVKADADLIRNASNSLAGVSNSWQNHLTTRQTEVGDQYNTKIEAIRPEVEANVQSYQVQTLREIQSIESRLSPLIAQVLSEVARWEYEEKKYESMGENYQSSRDRARRTKNQFKSQLQNLETQRAESIQRTKTHYQRLIDLEWERIHSLERERDGKIATLEQKKEEITSVNKVLESKLNKLLQRKNASLGVIDEVGVNVPSELSLKFGEEPFFVLVPFCLARLSGDSTRYIVIPPLVFQKSEGILQRFGKVFGVQAIPAKSRTERIEKILKKRLEEAIEKDKDLNEELVKKAPASNLLAQKKVKEEFFRGLDQLRDLGWLKEKDYTEYKQSITGHFSVK